MTSSTGSEFKLRAKIVNGGIAGIVGVTCVFPIDLVKTRLQSQSNTNRIYTSMFDCFRKSLKSQGLKGMYSGSGVNILLITPEKAIKLTANDYFRHLLTDKNGKLTLSREMAAGAGAGLCQIIVTTPMELLKIAMQMQSVGPQTSKQQQTASKIALQLVKEKGILGLYKGTFSTMLRDVTFSLIYFPLFANLNNLGPKRKSGESVFWVSFISGCFSGAFAAVAVNPIDVVKTRLQLLKKIEGQSYNGVLDAFMKIYKNEGVPAFFKGSAARMMVISPLFGIAQMVYLFEIAEQIFSVF